MHGSDRESETEKRLRASLWLVRPFQQERRFRRVSLLPSKKEMPHKEAKEERDKRVVERHGPHLLGNSETADARLFGLFRQRPRLVDAKGDESGPEDVTHAFSLLMRYAARRRLRTTEFVCRSGRFATRTSKSGPAETPVGKRGSCGY